ncbi:CLL_collapsed_G0005810.mRNA.1.CDS.1 [Saccharomyces cerevisiae]|nr:CLL_collapsed_G0005810.mRNA.1.CDS.1 [Saccharomyces cerevisiae]
MILGPEQTPNEKTTLDNCGLARRNLVLLKAVHTNCDSWNMNRYPLTLLKMAKHGHFVEHGTQEKSE